MTNTLTTKQNTLTKAGPMAARGEVANQVAADSVFADYRSRKAPQTIRRQDAGLRLFADYLSSVGVNTFGDNEPLTGAALAVDPAAWVGLTWGLVEGFNRWQLQKGYSVGSVNVRLSTVKTYAKLAAKAGTVDRGELRLILTVAGYGRTEGKRIDEQREAADVPIRTGSKKAEAVVINRTQAHALKHDHEDNPQGRRDALLMCLLIDHGLRVGEVAGLKVKDFNLVDRTFTFYRGKVDKVQTHELTRATYEATKAYFEHDVPEDLTKPVLRASRKGGHLTAAGISTQKINLRVQTLGLRVGIAHLSPHDCRHYWATTAARNKTPIDRLQDAGGWNSPAMPMHYVEAAKIANEGVNLG